MTDQCLSSLSLAELKQLIEKEYSATQINPGNHGSEDNVYGSSSFLNNNNNSSHLITQEYLLKQDILSSQHHHATHSEKAPWKENPQYFEMVLISKLACIKILNHSLRGGDIEIMGMLVGTVQGTKLIVYDCYELPVEGTETRVNAQLESYEYMVQYMDEIIHTGGSRNTTSTYDSSSTNTRNILNIIGWYHSHPGYDCWLSNIDVQTQELNQNFQDPYVAIVVDPHKSVKEDKLSIGAYRTLSGKGDTKFFELPLFVFDSDLNLPLKDSKLKFETPVFDDSYDSELLDKLIDTVKQWNSFIDAKEAKAIENKTVTGHKKDNLPINSTNQITSNNSNDILPSDLNCVSSTFNHEKKIRSGSVSSSTSFSTDTDRDRYIANRSDNDSDIDISNTKSIDGGIESMTSSVYTMRDTNTVSAANTTTSPSFLHTRQTSLDNSRSSQRRDHMSGSLFNSVRTLHGEFSMRLDTDTLERNDYKVHKKMLLASKTREYKKLRFFRDTFTL
ncbi:COP9 signalosome catalytic subunit RRI1 NDAI_0H03760 [Naumovozyma dairenensis CBS 421]|uniref:COP9 signalosome complex subunit 5 n=1 Tax=Naumovozyma dairenensis (strain ATCC 10597 / BCRC 20456 / CBS 421 / NBRC 0211 / NRRL Y-12639) TaxID=1071378 RepID=G0WFI8_NAUDC|nr:hypothetical protein NDAI_0H03760 [Naumovozyma dairenensis CBS 421]CCD26549.1 hypothetical protein NDAI_0H03760 [Naumovozyma dairenensis CBS 421]